MALDTIISQIKTILEGVSGIGVVHDYERNTLKPDVFKSLYSQADDSGKLRINGWTITRGKTEESRQSSQATTGGRTVATHTIIIRGYYSFLDDQASEKNFRQLVEAVRTELRGHFDLDGTCLRTALPQCPVNEPHLIANTYLVHYSEIHFDVSEYIIV